MTDRAFDRAFSRAAAASDNTGAEMQARHKKQALKSDTQEPAVEATPMQISDAVQRILQADKDKDYIRLMQLPQVEADALGQPVWTVTSAEVSRAYRKMSVLVHPDKNPGADAQQAFEALNQAHRKLRDRGELEGILKAAAEAAVLRREAAEAAATPEERIALQHAKALRAQELRKKESSAFQAEIMRQLQQKKDMAKRKRTIATKSRQKYGEDTEDLQAAQEFVVEEKEEEPTTKRRSKPKFMF